MKTGVVQWILSYLKPPRPASDADFLRWEQELFDSGRWQPRALLRRCRGWVTATRRRKWLAGLFAAVMLLLVLPMGLGAVATAQTTATTPSSVSSVNSALSWTGVTDTSGVPLTSYVFASAGDSIFHPKNTAMAFMLGLEYAGWMVIVITAIWLIGYALSFKWLNLFGTALVDVSEKFSSQLATTIVLVTCATIGAFIVAYFVVRGFHAKATAQIATMLLVGVIGPLYLAHPMSDAMSSNGLLAQGRDLGISVAAGLNGTDTTDPARLVATMQTDLADNFARHPLQVWNFGHEIDTEPGCAQAWTSAVATGNEGTVKSAMQSCGDGSAYNAANNPSVGQIGAGILLLFAGAILLLFGAYLAIKVIKSALGVIWAGFQSIIGFAGSGFIYGPPQIFLVRSVVDGFIAAGEMAMYVIFTGIYVLFMGDLFSVAGGQVMSVFVIGAIVEIVAIVQLRHVGASMQRARQWTTNRLGLAIQGAGGGGGGGGGGGAGFGTGGAGSMTAMGALGNISALNGNPLVAWAALGTPNPISPLSRVNKKMTQLNKRMLLDDRFKDPKGVGLQGMMQAVQLGAAAKRGARAYGGINTFLGGGAAFNEMKTMGGGLSDFAGALMAAGFKDDRIIYHLQRSFGKVEQNAANYILSDQLLANAVAAMQRAQSSAVRFVDGDPNQSPFEVAADYAALESAVFMYRGALRNGITLDGGAASGPERDFADLYMRNPDMALWKELNKLAEGDELAMGTGNLAGIDSIGAQRLKTWIGSAHSERVSDAMQRVIGDPENYDRMRELRTELSYAQRTDSFASGVSLTEKNTLHPPDQRKMGAPTNWGRMSGVTRHLQRRA
ncbi:hypothetical protein KO481_35450 [Nocardia sp. NEAU-G5]|uniref:Uncharacterized protein n=1 Tax=Nocardia albiluteola TaxID=2842303 RepID=A0ABS6B933_9NOCA|nr:hypothetical protein [Nocardia albiluteola]MBU3066802.1 hypothetical protein [Nocardia albiluteola]